MQRIIRTNSIRRVVCMFLTEEDGITAIEYALLGMLIALAIVAGANLIGFALNTMYSDVGDAIQNATPPTVP